MRESRSIGRFACWCGLGVLGVALLMEGGAAAQQSKPAAVQPHADDSSVPSSPVNGLGVSGRADDSSAAASPVTPELAPASLKAGTALRVRLVKGLDSSKLHNGDNVTAKLMGAVRTSTGKTIAVGTNVTATVVSTVAAGKISSAGELSLQLTTVGAVSVVSDVLSFEGKPGQRVLPDDAPGKGTDAVVAAGTVLTFHVAL
jgi:hypothetical protein